MKILPCTGGWTLKLPRQGAKIRQQATFSLQTTSALILIDAPWAKLVSECIQTGKKWMFWIWKNQKQSEGATSTCFLLILFLIQTVYLFTFGYIPKPPKIKDDRLTSTSMWFGGKRLLAGGCFYHFAADGESFVPLRTRGFHWAHSYCVSVMFHEDQIDCWEKTAPNELNWTELSIIW